MASSNERETLAIIKNKDYLIVSTPPNRTLSITMCLFVSTPAFFTDFLVGVTVKAPSWVRKVVYIPLLVSVHVCILRSPRHSHDLSTYQLCSNIIT